jgi:putative acetyltransferase
VGLAELREAVDDDWWALVALIGACWAEYPGCVMDAAGECPELLAPASHYRAAGGRLWVLPEGPWLAACVGVVPRDPGANFGGVHPENSSHPPGGRAELVKLYVARHRRGHGLGAALAALVEDEARAAGATELELWSDSRFDAAHRLYRRLGFQPTGATRDLHDRSGTTEHHFYKRLKTPPT